MNDETGTLIMGGAGSGFLRWGAVEITRVLESVRARLDLSPVASAALGRSLAGAALLLRLSNKAPTRLMIRVAGDGPLGEVIAEADAEGNLRGQVGSPQLELPPTPEGKLDVGRAVGKGSLVVERLVRGKHQKSVVELVTGEIGDDLAHFLAQSEQTHSAVMVGVLAKSFGVAAAGGFIGEILPGAPEELVDQFAKNISRLTGVSRLLELDGIDSVVASALEGIDHVAIEPRPLRFHCRCSRERLLARLGTLPENELEHLAGGEPVIEAICRFCGTVYQLSRQELALSIQ